MPFKQSEEQCKMCDGYGTEKFSKGNYKGRYCNRHWAESPENDEAINTNWNIGENRKGRS